MSILSAMENLTGTAPVRALAQVRRRKTMRKGGSIGVGGMGRARPVFGTPHGTSRRHEAVAKAMERERPVLHRQHEFCDP
jgi:hypothetical protein